MRTPVSRLMRTAAQHALNLRDRQADTRALDDAADWISESAENEAAFDDAEAFLAACDQIREAGRAPAVRISPPFPRPRPLFATPLAAAASIALVIAAAAAAIYGAWPMLSRQEPVKYATDRGEIRTIWLRDGSAIRLAGATEVAVAYRWNLRSIELRHGEAVFTVAPNPRRPFVVQAGVGSVTAVGTEFDVRREGGRTTVAVSRGIVDVAASGEISRSAVRIGRAMQVSYFADGGLGPAQSADLADILAWQQGRLQFVREPLGSVVAELNRYSQTPIRLANRSLAETSVTGTVDIALIRDWLRGLASATGASLTVSDQEIVIGPSDAAGSDSQRTSARTSATKVDEWTGRAQVEQGRARY